MGTVPKNGNLVIVTLDDRIFVGRFCQTEETIILEHNGGVIKTRDCTVEGVVVQVCKRLLLDEE